MRVLAIPGPRYPQNSYFPLLWSALEAQGAKMIDPRSVAALTIRFDILHVHFPEHLVTERSLPFALSVGPLFVAYVAVARLAGVKLVWTIHEVSPRDRRWLARPYLWCVRRLTNAYIFMNQNSEDEFFRRYNRERQKSVCRVPHSAYPAAMITGARRSDMRTSLTHDANSLIIGFLGELKPYKNPAVLQYLPTSSAGGKPLSLVVAGNVHGSCDVGALERMFCKIGSGHLVQIPERLSDERLSELIQSVDITLLPYLSGWNSGFAMYALACRGRLLCSSLPMFREIAESLGPPWVYLFDHTVADLSQELATAISRIEQDTPDEDDHARLKRFLEATSFQSAAEKHIALYERLQGDRDRRKTMDSHRD